VVRAQQLGHRGKFEFALCVFEKNTLACQRAQDAIQRALGGTTVLCQLRCTDRTTIVHWRLARSA
jgi:hypothetical protein